MSAFSHFRVQPGKRLRLADISPQKTKGFDGDKEQGRTRVQHVLDPRAVTTAWAVAQAETPVRLALAPPPPSTARTDRRRAPPEQA